MTQLHAIVSLTRTMTSTLCQASAANHVLAVQVLLRPPYECNVLATNKVACHSLVYGCLRV